MVELIVTIRRNTAMSPRGIPCLLAHDARRAGRIVAPDEGVFADMTATRFFVTTEEPVV